MEFIRSMGYILLSLPDWFIYFAHESNGVINDQHNYYEMRPPPQPSMKTSCYVRPQPIGILCEWFRPIAGLIRRVITPRPPCVLPCRPYAGLPTVLPMCSYSATSCTAGSDSS